MKTTMWWNELSGSKKNAVQQIRRDYKFTRYEVLQAIEIGLLRWRFERKDPERWVLEEVEL